MASKNIKRKGKKLVEKIDFKYNLKLYINFLKNYKLLFIGLLIATLIVEATYVADKFIFKLLVDYGTAFAGKTLLLNAFVKMLIILAIVFFILVISRALLKWMHIYMVNHLEVNMILDLKRKFFNHIVGLSHSFHTTHRSGTLISRLTRGIRAIERITDVLVFNFAPLIFQLIIVIASLIYFDFISAIIVFITAVSYIAYNFLINSIQQTSRLKADYKEDVEKGFIGDVLTNIESVKYFGKEGVIAKSFAKISKIVRRLTVKNWDYWKWLDSGQVIILGIGTFFVMYFPITEFLSGTITLGTLVFIYTIFGNLLGPLSWFVHGIRDYYLSMSDFEYLFQYAKIENEIKDKPDAKELKIKNGKIEFKNVTFSYKKRKILDNFNLIIPAKKKYALVGLSGAGKSTIVKLLYRLYEVDSGEILIDDEDIKNLQQESLRSELSIVPQECVLFDDTIYNNIIFSNPKALNKEAKQAMKFSQLDKIMSILPKGDKTIVGERGIKLSGGEKQRVSIARAILADKKVLVLDEATSFLDSKTEHEIQRDLQKLMKGRTSIIIAHRLSTIMRADKIIVIDKSKIVQQGTHNQLIKQKGIYRKLWNLQKGGYIK